MMLMRRWTRLITQDLQNISNKTMMELITQYNKAAAEFASQYDVYSPHIISIIASVMMTRDGKGYPGGGFVHAVVANDLFRAVSTADWECYQNLKVITAANKFAHLPNEYFV